VVISTPSPSSQIAHINWASRDPTPGPVTEFFLVTSLIGLERFTYRGKRSANWLTADRKRVVRYLRCCSCTSASRNSWTLSSLIDEGIVKTDRDDVLGQKGILSRGQVDYSLRMEGGVIPRSGR
jgi:hypothetical protein